MSWQFYYLSRANEWSQTSLGILGRSSLDKPQGVITTLREIVFEVPTEHRIREVFIKCSAEIVKQYVSLIFINLFRSFYNSAFISLEEQISSNVYNIFWSLEKISEE